jgi:aspartyl-tRNA(Asn)/glutamyl-tRNA(Gln) amidotransferase subunit A
MQARPNLATLPIQRLVPELVRDRALISELLRQIAEAAIAIRETHSFIHHDPQEILQQAIALQETDSDASSAPCFGLPVSVKDLLDVAGAPTTWGSSAGRRQPHCPQTDAALVSAFRSRGALFVGKTHLNEWAYGITGENPWLGDCTIPGRPEHLTGGSSSGAAASVLGGAACLALGTDTGGSLRVPAALCGLVSFRSRDWFPDHTGVQALAPSFDTLGWIHRHLEDAAYLARHLGPNRPTTGLLPAPHTVGFLTGTILDDCEPGIRLALDAFRKRLESLGLQVPNLPATDWEQALEIFAPLQACEAWQIHRTAVQANPEDYSRAVRERLEWGGRISPSEHAQLVQRRLDWVAQAVGRFDTAPLLVLPAVPLAQLRQGADHTLQRPRILRLTTPASLGNWPVLTVPWPGVGDGESGTGFQIMAARGNEWALIALAEKLAPHW